MAVSEVTIPSDLMLQYRIVIVGADIMYINKLPFFVTMSRNIKFSTAELMLDQKHKTLVDHVKRIQPTRIQETWLYHQHLSYGRAV